MYCVHPLLIIAHILQTQLFPNMSRRQRIVLDLLYTPWEDSNVEINPNMPNRYDSSRWLWDVLFF